jgi:hypothetical protein
MESGSIVNYRPRTAVSALALLLVVGSGSGALAQRTRRPSTGRPEKRTKPDETVPAVVFEGTLERMDAKQLVVKIDEDKTVEFRVNKKTTFDKASKPIKRTDLEKGDRLSIDAKEDIDLTMIAVTVHVKPPGKPAAETVPEPVAKERNNFP